MTAQQKDQTDEVARLTRKLNRESRARIEAERLLEEKSSQLYDANQKLEIEARRAQSLTAAIESATDGVAITDKDGNYVFMNRSHAEMFGYDAAELLGESWETLYEEAEMKRFQKQVFPRLSASGYWRGETTGISKQGKYVLQDIALTALADGGLICATRDITNRRLAQIQARELEQRLVKAEQEAALFTLGNAVAHDFNNLLGAISGYAMLISKTVPEDSAAYGYAERIGVATDQAVGVIRSLEVERSNNTESLAGLDIVSLFETGVSIAQAIRPPGVTILVEAPDQAIVLANEVLLSRSLLNIVKNAFEIMGAEGELSIRIAKSASDGFANQTGYLSLGEPRDAYDWVVEIRDTGCGIRQEKLERIFDPFYSANSQRQGTGLGLQSLAGLAESGAAFVEVLTQFEYGTLFRLNFAAPPQLEQKVLSLNQVDSDQTDAKARILIVEDEVMMGEVILKTLQHLGYVCDLCHDPREGLKLLEDPTYEVDLVLSDMTMPHISGDQLVQKIRTLRPETPVIILSGQARYIKPSNKYAAILNKPVSADELDQAIKAVLA